ncbi:hypothetical protein V8G54_001604 [Vigna mungo]|uniref:Uncharacterized protein n=1 Tax=Vigna mungo TaxID=3915 RepID=A0AAQ3P8L0_VIGMU
MSDCIEICYKPKAKETGRMNSSRHRPLHTCGLSILVIVDIVIGKTQRIDGPLGSTLKRVTKLAKFAVPLIYAMQIYWLTILSFIDDAILAIEKVIEKLFPHSKRVFDKVDEIVVMIVSFPEKFEGAMNKFPTIIHEFPFLKRALTLVISRWNTRTIGVDRSCNEGYMDLKNFPPIISECEYKGIHDIALQSLVKGSYKEALERGKEDDPQENMEIGCEVEKKVDKGDYCECKEGREKNHVNNKECDDAIVKCLVGESVKDGS